MLMKRHLSGAKLAYGVLCGMRAAVLKGGSGGGWGLTKSFKFILYLSSSSPSPPGMLGVEDACLAETVSSPSDCSSS